MKQFSKGLVVSLLFLLTGISNNSWSSDWIYHASDGDTLWDLCLKYTNKRGCWLELGDYNGVRNDRAIPLGTEIRIPVEWLASPPVVGQVVSVFGDVEYQRNSSFPAEKLNPGQDLHLGARLTSRTGSAFIQFGPDNQLLLREDSILNLDTMSGPAEERYSAELGLPSGAVEVKVKPRRNSRFRITTPAAIAAVRGTEYRVDSLGAAGDSMRSEVLSGAVEVASGKVGVEVPAGYGVATTRGEAPGKPRELLLAPKFDADYSAVVLPLSIGWNSDPDAVGWVLDLMEPGVSGTVLSSYRTTEPRQVFEELAEGCYKLKLRAVDAEGFNGLNSDAPLCIVSRPATVDDISEISMDPSSETMRVSWSAIEGAQRYRIEIAADPDFNEIVDTQLTDATSAELDQSGESVFHLRVFAIDGAGNESRAGAVRNYTLPPQTPWEVITIVVTLMVLAL